MYCLFGLGDEKLQERIEDSYGLLRYIGIFTQSPRSAEGLRALLSDRINEPGIQIVQCVPRSAEIPRDQRLSLGVSANRLGEDTYLGSRIVDRMGKFRVAAGPLDSDTFHRLLPDKSDFKTMNKLIYFYLDKPLTWDVELKLSRDTVRPVQLGAERWAQLGWNSWIYSGTFEKKDVAVTLQKTKDRY